MQNRLQRTGQKTSAAGGFQQIWKQPNSCKSSLEACSQGSKTSWSSFGCCSNPEETGRVELFRQVLDDSLTLEEAGLSDGCTAASLGTVVDRCFSCRITAGCLEARFLHGCGLQISHQHVLREANARQQASQDWPEALDLRSMRL